MKNKQKKKKLDNWFLLTWKKAWIIIVGWFLAIVLHNLFYAIFKNYFDSTGGDEPFFFIIAVIIIPIYFIVCFIYTLIKMIKNKTLFESKFVTRMIISFILGVAVIVLIIKFNIINSEMGFMLTGIFIACTLVFYSLIKLIKKKLK
ncbi:hypothetical protein KAI04_00125 [Candidatus Pacearchaeota archaeon]|nr:hypothetical protein [Candidatus Pacearchaeota archaeon]